MERSLAQNSPTRRYIYSFRSDASGPQAPRFCRTTVVRLRSSEARCLSWRGCTQGNRAASCRRSPTEKLVMGEIDLDQLNFVDGWLDTAGHYSQPETLRWMSISKECGAIRSPTRPLDSTHFLLPRRV